jgi:hypothetical protein
LETGPEPGIKVRQPEPGKIGQLQRPGSSKHVPEGICAGVGFN